MALGFDFSRVVVPVGKSLHFWGDGHYSFEDKFRLPAGACFAAVDVGDGASDANARGGVGDVQRSAGCNRCRSLCVGGVGEKVASVGSAGDRGATGFVYSRHGELAGAGDGSQEDPVESVCAGETQHSVSAGLRGPNWERNQAWKKKRKQKVTTTVGQSAVPEWRQKRPVAVVHKGVFSECSEEVQRELRESRAKMLVEKNKTDAAEAAQRRRLVEARTKTRMVEEEVEKKRLELVASNRKLYEAQMSKYPAGFAETVVSLGLESVMGTPSLSSGSVSPDSSISVAELKRREAAMEMLVAKVAELTAVVDSYKEKEASQGVAFKRSGEVHVKDGYSRDSSPVRASRVAATPGIGRQRMSSLERAKRERFGLPLKGPGSGMDGYGRWD